MYLLGVVLVINVIHARGSTESPGGRPVRRNTPEGNRFAVVKESPEKKFVIYQPMT